MLLAVVVAPGGVEGRVVDGVKGGLWLVLAAAAAAEEVAAAAIAAADVAAAAVETSEKSILSDLYVLCQVDMERV